MVKHIVLWKIRDDDQKQQNIDKMIDMLTSLVGKLEGLVSIEMGYNFNTDSEYDVVLYASFKNAAALKYYQTHPEHVKCKNFIGSVSIGRTAADYFYEEGVKASRPFNEVPDAPEITVVNTSTKDEIPVPQPTIAPPPAKPKEERSAFFSRNQPSVQETPPLAPVTPPPVPVTPPPAPMIPPPAPVTPPSAKPKKEKSSFFAERQPEPQTPSAPSGGNTWTCPSCGKVMPKYVGTCGCGTPQPFSFDDDPPALQPDPHDAEAMKAAGSAYPDMKAKSAARSVSTPKEEKTSMFASRKKSPEPAAPPAPAGGNTWTCPSCGKVMPKYVGTCGCGTPQPFSFDDDPPALQPDPHDAEAMNAASSAYPDLKARNTAKSEEKKDLPSGFRRRKKTANETDVPPSQQSSNTWTCPGCGKVMPKYISTCGCGTPQPFGFDDEPSMPIGNSSAPQSFGMPTIQEAERSDEDDRIMDASAFNDAAPSLQSYSPQTNPPVDTTPDPDLGYIKNDRAASKPFGSSSADNAPFNFDDSPEPSPMRFDDAPPPAPMRFDNSRAAAPAPKPEKKHIFGGKKAKEAEVMRQAEAAVNSRKDVPDIGATWTCPNCGKVMPKYVGTCGCGESQPFDF